LFDIIMTYALLYQLLIQIHFVTMRALLQIIIDISCLSDNM